MGAFRFARSLAALSHCLRGGPSRSEWAAEIEGVVAELQKLNSETEQHFLAVGGKLMGFLSALRALHGDVQGLSTLMGSEQTRHACEALMEVRQYANGMTGRPELSGSGLLAIQESAGRIQREFATLASIVLSFRITAIVARIETAHLAMAESEFGSLADDMRTCSDGIQERAEHVLKSVGAFETRVGQTLKVMSQLDATQRKELPALLSAVDGDLEQLGIQQRQTADASVRLSEAADAVVKELGTIAVSLQFHDITRQRVEHVVEALAEVAGAGEAVALTAPVAGLVELQKAQLMSAAESFVASTRKINRDLDGIALRVSEMAAASKRMVGGDQRTATNDFLGEMLGRFSGVLQSVDQSHSLQTVNESMTADLQALVSELQASVAEVRAIEIRLSFIAINAAISACHLGVAGEPLNVVASTMKGLQTECSGRSQAAETALESITGAIEGLVSKEATGEDGSTLVNALKDRISELQSAQGRSVHATRAIADAAEQLCGDLEDARRHLEIGDVFASTARRCSQLLESVLAQAPAASHKEQAEIAEMLRTRYTMQAEHDLHAVAYADAGVAASSVESAPADDIEFF